MAEKKCSCNRKKVRERTESEKNALICRINRLIGQLGGISKMISEDRYCGDVLVQLAAVCSSVKSLSSVILEEHLKECVTESVKRGETEAVDEVADLFRKFV